MRMLRKSRLGSRNSATNDLAQSIGSEDGADYKRGEEYSGNFRILVCERSIWYYPAREIVRRLVRKQEVESVYDKEVTTNYGSNADLLGWIRWIQPTRERHNK